MLWICDDKKWIFNWFNGIEYLRLNSIDNDLVIMSSTIEARAPIHFDSYKINLEKFNPISIKPLLGHNGIYTILECWRDIAVIQLTDTDNTRSSRILFHNQWMWDFSSILQCKLNKIQYQKRCTSHRLAEPMDSSKCKVLIII